MYISLFLSLGISAGAVLTKQWILEYQRRVKKYQVPAEQAKHRQAMYDSWLQWYIPEFASLLGTLVLVALLTLFVSLYVFSNHHRHEPSTQSKFLCAARCISMALTTLV